MVGKDTLNHSNRSISHETRQLFETKRTPAKCSSHTLSGPLWRLFGPFKNN